MPILQRAIELWYHDPACTTPVLKLMAELVHNRYEPSGWQGFVSASATAWVSMPSCVLPAPIYLCSAGCQGWEVAKLALFQLGGKSDSSQIALVSLSETRRRDQEEF